MLGAINRIRERMFRMRFSIRSEANQRVCASAAAIYGVPNLVYAVDLSRSGGHAGEALPKAKTEDEWIDSGR